MKETDAETEKNIYYNFQWFSDSSTEPESQYQFSTHFKGLSSNDVLKNSTTVILRQLSLQPFPGLNCWPLPLLTLSQNCVHKLQFL